MEKRGPVCTVCEMQIDAATVESSMEFPQKIKNGAAVWPSSSSSGNISKETQTLIQKNTCTSVLIAVLFTVANIWKTSERPLVHEWIKKLYYPGWCGWVDWVPACKLKGRWFESQSGHVPGLWARSPVGSVREATVSLTHQCFYLPSHLSKNNK